MQMRWPSLSSGCRHGMNSRSSSTSINNMTAAQELFYEACSALYNDILDAVDHHLVGAFFLQVSATHEKKNLDLPSENMVCGGDDEWYLEMDSPGQVKI